MAMGNYFFTDPDGNEVMVEYTFGYMLDDNDELRIVLHHSSLPYAPRQTPDRLKAWPAHPALAMRPTIHHTVSNPKTRVKPAPWRSQAALGFKSRAAARVHCSKPPS